MAAAEPMEVLVNARHLTGPRTGIEIYMEQLMGALGASGRVRVTALTWSPIGLALPNVREVVTARRPGFRTGSLAATLWKLWFDQWGCLRGVRGDAPALVHGMDGFLPRGVRRRDRAVVTVHDLGWQVHPELYPAKIRAMYGRLFPWAVRRADRFIAVSRYTADDLMRREQVSASRIDVVYHGLDPAFDPASSDPLPDVEGGEPPYLLAVGGVSPRKNTRRLIEAFARWRARGPRQRAHELRITGTSLDPEFVEGAASLPEGVKLLGYVDKARLRRLYAGAAAFVYPGIYEGFGLPIIEAMACGAPVVTSTTGAAPEIAAGAAVLVDPFSAESIEAGIEFATRREESLRLRELGAARSSSFTWSAAAEATVEVYRRADQ